MSHSPALMQGSIAWDAASRVVTTYAGAARLSRQQAVLFDELLRAAEAGRGLVPGGELAARLDIKKVGDLFLILRVKLARVGIVLESRGGGGRRLSARVPVRRPVVSAWLHRALWAAAFAGALFAVAKANAESDLRAIVTSEANAAGVPVALAHAVVAVESGWRAHLRGRAGEWGLFQVLCPTARSVGFGGNCGALADPRINARYGLAYLRLALDRAEGDWGRAASLYNRGVYAAPALTAYSQLVLQAAGRSAGDNAVVQPGFNWFRRAFGDQSGRR